MVELQRKSKPTHVFLQILFEKIDHDPFNIFINQIQVSFSPAVMIIQCYRGYLM